MKLLHPGSSSWLGSILEVNILGDTKDCSFDCVYCHLCPTIQRMSKKKEDVDVPNAEQVLNSGGKE